MEEKSIKSLQYLNEMLRTDKIPSIDEKFDESNNSFRLISIKTTDLMSGVEYALNNFNEVAALENKHKNGQPIQITIEHLQFVKKCMEVEKLITTTDELDGIIFNKISISLFLILCYRQPKVFNTNDIVKIYVDAERAKLVEKLFFGKILSNNEVNLPSIGKFFNPNYPPTTQIIFDSSDVISALDALLKNMSDRTYSPWRIGTVFVQESLKDDVFQYLSNDRLSIDKQYTIQVSDDQVKSHEELVKRFGGKMISNKYHSMTLLFDIPPKYLKENYTKETFPFPVVVNFFRTAKEVAQLAKEIPIEKYSIWTEDIGLFYEVADQLDASIIWSNSIGLADKMMCGTIYGFETNQPTRYEVITYIYVCFQQFKLIH